MALGFPASTLSLSRLSGSALHPPYLPFRPPAAADCVRSLDLHLSLKIGTAAYGVFRKQVQPPPGLQIAHCPWPDDSTTEPSFCPRPVQSCMAPSVGRRGKQAPERHQAGCGSAMWPAQYRLPAEPQRAVVMAYTSNQFSLAQVSRRWVSILSESTQLTELRHQEYLESAVFLASS